MISAYFYTVEGQKKGEAVRNKKNLLLILLIIASITIYMLLWIDYTISSFSPVLLVLSIISKFSMLTAMIYFIIKNSELKSQVVRDSMTQIYNWKFIKDVMIHEIERYKRNSHVFGVIYFDIDDFRKLNNELGHYVGDQKILEIVEIVQSIIRLYDIFGRMGGEEFCIILPEMDKESILNISERIRQSIEDAENNDNIPLTISVGSTLVREDDTYFSIYNRVDKAMKKSKEKGKNLITFL